MAKNHLFLIHGIGRHEKGWSDTTWQPCILENLKAFAPYTDMSPEEIDNDLHFFEVTYDAVLDKSYRQRWKELANAIADTALPASVRSVMQELRQEPDARLPEYFWTHALDAILWFSLKQARGAVIQNVAKQLTRGLKAAQLDGADVHILSHSLGTSVIHDTLLCLAAGTESATVYDPNRGGIRWKSLVTVANVSRVVGAMDSPSDDLDVDAFRSHFSRVQGGDLVQFFVNIRHALDAVTFPRRFKPDWETPPFWYVETDRYDELLNIHDFETQFDHPVAARRCLRLFTGIDSLGTADEMKALWRRYDQKYGQSAGGLFSRLHEFIGPDPERKLGPGELARYFVELRREVLA